MALRQTTATLKKKWHLLFLLEFAFAFSLFFFVVYIKEKLLSYLVIMRAYLPRLLEIRDAAQKNDLNLAEAMQTINVFEQTLGSAPLFMNVIVPLVLFLIFVVFQFLIWWYVKGTFIKNLKWFFIQFVGVTAFVSVIIFIFVKIVLNNLLEGTSWVLSFTEFLLYPFIIFYMLTVLYLCLRGDHFKSFLHRVFFIGIRRWYVVILPIALLFFVVCLAALFLFVPLFLQYWVEGKDTGLTWMVLYVVPCILVGLLLKVFLHEKIKKLVK